MEKEQKENIQTEDLAKEENNQSPKTQDQADDHNKKEENKKEPTPEEKILELEDKLARIFAEMENQRRRFEKEKDCLLYTSPSPRDRTRSRMPSSA